VRGGTRRAVEKSEGSGALGIASLADKVVLQAVVTVLNQDYEADFLNVSFGIRQGRHQHQALDAVYVAVGSVMVELVERYWAELDR
jgi:retron-type reverse transcriptase